MTLTQINKAGLDELALDHVFTIGASGTDHYTFQGEGLNGTVNDPTLYLTRGKTYRFENGTGSHPIRIQSTSGASGTAYNTGVTNNAGSGTVIVEVQHDAPDVLYYQCTSHAAMNGILYITGALADGGVTTAKIATDAVTNAKIASDAVGSAEIANNAITTVKIANDAVTGVKIAAEIDNSHITSSANIAGSKLADDSISLAKLEHGTSSNDGKFLRANNGADPSFESIPAGITINNQADNRIITATGTTDTLNSEANLTFRLASADPILTVQGTSAGHAQLSLKTGGTTDHCSINFGDSGDGDIGEIRYTHSSDSMQFDTNNLERMRIDSSGKVMINTTTLSQSKTPMLEVKSDSNTSSDFAAVFSSANGTSGTGISYSMIDAFNNTNNATLRIRTNGGDAIHVSDTQNVGIGTTNPGQRLEVRQTGASHAIIAANRPNSDTFAVALGNNSSNNGVISVNNSDLLFGRDNSGTFTERMRMRNDGGLCFNGDSAAANALDDYEEGSFTPTAFGWSTTGTNTYGTQAGRYIKVGNLVTVFFHVEWSNLSNASGVLAIGGFPYTHRTSNYYGSTAVQCRYINYSGDTVYAVYGSGFGTSVLLYAQNDNGNHSYVGIDAAGRVEGTINYLAG